MSRLNLIHSVKLDVPANDMTVHEDGGNTFQRGMYGFAGLPADDKENWNGGILDIYEIRENSTYEQMLDSIGGIGRKLLTQGQIIAFCQRYAEHLRQGGYATFFPFRSKGELFVADVRVGGVGSLGACADRFGFVGGWGAEHRPRLVVFRD